MAMAPRSWTPVATEGAQGAPAALELSPLRCLPALGLTQNAALMQGEGLLCRLLPPAFLGPGGKPSNFKEALSRVPSAE